MKKQLLSVIALGMAFTFSPMVWADNTAPQPKDRLPMSKILQNLERDGYSIITKIELEGEAFKARVFDARGKEHRVEVEPKSGKINHSKAQPTRLTLGEAVKKVEEAGYQNIYKVKADDNEYEMKAFDKDNKRVSLDVDAATGKINKEWF
jgi:hypothetical protein